MVQKTFSIYADDLSGCRLFIEAGTQHIAAWFADTITGSLKALEFFQFDREADTNMNDVAAEVKKHSRLMSMQMDAALIVLENAACTLVPSAFFNESLAAGYLNITAGEDTEENSLLEEHYKEYSVVSKHPTAYAAAVKKHLAVGPLSHKFTTLLKKHSNYTPALPTVARVVFYPQRLIILVVKNDVLQIVQSIDFSTAEDALYSIMHICTQCGVDANTTPVIASGLINAGSSLHDILHRYIEHFEIEQSPDAAFAAEGFAEHPRHYFLPFIQ